jgi:TRAP-type C4-dicarboxylate transport system permease small subunit
MKKAFWIITLTLSLYGIYIGYNIISTATSAMQEIDGIAMALAFAIIPYIITRAICEITDDIALITIGKQKVNDLPNEELNENDTSELKPTEEQNI